MHIFLNQLVSTACTPTPTHPHTQWAVIHLLPPSFRFTCRRDSLRALEHHLPHSVLCPPPSIDSRSFTVRNVKSLIAASLSSLASTVNTMCWEQFHWSVKSRGLLRFTSLAMFVFYDITVSLDWPQTRGSDTHCSKVWVTSDRCRLVTNTVESAADGG